MPENDLVICLYWNTMSTAENCVKKGISWIIKLQWNAASGLLVEAFKHPISEKVKLARSMLKSSIAAIFCFTDNKILQLTKAWMSDFEIP